MCGRYVLYGPGEALLEGFSLKQLPPFTARYNIAPSTEILAVRSDPAKGRVAEFMRWGLVPHRASDASIGTPWINARAETLASRPAFRDAFRSSRCMIPANGFYEWKAVRAGSRSRRQPYYVHRADGMPMAMAGLYARRETSEGPLVTCCIVTTDANEKTFELHDRMPVVLDAQGVDTWLDARSDTAALTPLLRPCPDDWLALHAVGPAVSNVRNEGAALIEAASVET